MLDRIGARSIPVGPGDLERVRFAFRLGLADTLLATPSFALYLASQEDAPRVHHLVTAGEPGGGIAEVRDQLQRALGTTVTEVMRLVTVGA